MGINNSKRVRIDPYFDVIQDVREKISVIASSNSSVLLRGETGTGKSLMARWIHDHSPRKGCAFVDINCAALGGELLKSELFGHALGSFTGAIRDRPGLIEMANGGTLFLDEIGDMNIGVQCLLLKAIEDKKYRRVGENQQRESDFRLICASHRNLLDAVEKGTFREDLYHRINTVEVYMPPLRERADAIPGLIEYILKTMGYKHFPVCGSIVDELTRRAWRGNIRELSKTLESGLVFARDEKLALEHFTDVKPAESADPAETVQSADPYVEHMERLRNEWNLKIIEKVYIRRALAYFGDDKECMAAALGMSLSSLYRKLNELRKERADDQVSV